MDACLESPVHIEDPSKIYMVFDIEVVRRNTSVLMGIVVMLVSIMESRMDIAESFHCILDTVVP